MDTKYLTQTRDVDMNDVMKPVAILDIFQDASEIHAEKIGVGYDAIKRLGYAWVVLFQEFEIKNIPPYCKEIMVSTWPKPKQRLEFEREFLMHTLDHKPLVQGRSNWAVISMADHRLVRANEVDFNGTYETFTNYPNRCPRKLRLDSNLIEDWFSYKVLYDDLDHNGHMNNARYLNILFNEYPLYQTRKYISKVQIAYIKEARLHEMIEVGHYHENGKEAYIGYVNKELCFECLMEVKEL